MCSSTPGSDRASTLASSTSPVDAPGRRLAYTFDTSSDSSEDADTPLFISRMDLSRRPTSSSVQPATPSKRDRTMTPTPSPSKKIKLDPESERKAKSKAQEFEDVLLEFYTQVAEEKARGDKLAAENKDLLDQIDQDKRTIADRETWIDILDKNIIKLEENVDRKAKEISNYSALHDEFIVLRLDLVKRYDALVNRNDDLTKDNEALTKTNNALIKRIEDQTEKSEEDHNLAVASLQRQIEPLQQLNASLKKELKESLQRLLRQCQNYEDTSRRFMEMKKQEMATSKTAMDVNRQEAHITTLQLRKLLHPAAWGGAAGIVQKPEIGEGLQEGGGAGASSE